MGKWINNASYLFFFFILLFLSFSGICFVPLLFGFWKWRWCCNGSLEGRILEGFLHLEKTWAFAVCSFDVFGRCNWNYHSFVSNCLECIGEVLEVLQAVRRDVYHEYCKRVKNWSVLEDCIRLLLTSNWKINLWHL